MARIGYARCSTELQDLTAQRAYLESQGVAPDRVYTDHGLSGTRRDRPGLDQALAACREGDEFLVMRLDRLGRSTRDLLSILQVLEERRVVLRAGSMTYDPADPVGVMLIQILAVVAEFEASVTRARTREGMRRAAAAGRLKGKQPSLTPAQDRECARLLDAGELSAREIGELFGCSRPSVYRARDRHRLATGQAEQPVAAAASA
jgi:DNA invertase Pin-like site-specific DNA recombinase